MWHRWVAAVVLLAGLATGGSPRQPPVDERVRERLRNRIEEPGLVPSAAVSRFYEQRIFRPAWSRDGRPTGAADELLAAIVTADQEGLRPEDYGGAGLERSLSDVRRHEQTEPDIDGLVTLDLLLTDAFLGYGADLQDGHIDPDILDLERDVRPRERDLTEALESALATNQVGRALSTLLPPPPGYAALKAAFARYRDLVARGGWTSLPPGPPLRLGGEDSRVDALRCRLAMTGDINAAESNQVTLFDAALDEGVRRFQQRHGLAVDGVVGRETLAALNVPARQRARQIRLNLERWRWLPQDLGLRHILVNIAGFELEVVEGHKRVMRMRTIVGRQYRRTPVFTSAMTYLVINPYWHVPRSIATLDLLPLIQRDPTYLVSHHLDVLRDIDGRLVTVDPSTVDWSTLTAERFPFRLRQRPGPDNALGRMKFMLPNRFNVYLHDTPAQELFERPARSFSSGCIRIDRPIELAGYVLRGDARWTPEALETALETRVDYTVRLPEPVPVHVLYWTSWVDERGLQFRTDLYGRDDGLAAALGAPPPES